MRLSVCCVGDGEPSSAPKESGREGSAGDNGGAPSIVGGRPRKRDEVRRALRPAVPREGGLATPLDKEGGLTITLDREGGLIILLDREGGLAIPSPKEGGLSKPLPREEGLSSSGSVNLMAWKEVLLRQSMSSSIDVIDVSEVIGFVAPKGVVAEQGTVLCTAGVTHPKLASPASSGIRALRCLR